MPCSAKKRFIFKLDHNFSIDLMLRTHYERKISWKSAIISAIHFALRVVSAEIQTNRSKPRHWRKIRKQTLLDSYLYSLPSSGKKNYNFSNIGRIGDFKQQIYWKYSKLGKIILCINIWFCMVLRAFENCENDFCISHIWWLFFFRLHVTTWIQRGQVLLDINCWLYLKNLFRNFNIDKNLTGITVILHEDICTFKIRNLSILLTIKISG